MNRLYFASSIKRRTPRSLYRSGVMLILGLFLLTVSLGVFGAIRPEATRAASSTTLTFQARLLNADGSLVADGTYNVEFKIYDTVGSGASAQGVCSLDSSTDDCWWLETRTGANKVTVKNGYVYANLGSVTAFSSTIPWDQELWITMNIGGTGAPSWDGEMTPRFKVAAVPYAFAAAKLQVTDSAITNKLVFATPSASNKTITLPNETGTVCTTGSICSGYASAAGYATISLNNIASTNLSAALNVTSGNLALQTTTSGNITLTSASSTGLVNVLTGSLQVGNGVPGVTLNGEDVYIEGTLEVDGAQQFDGALVVTSTATFNGNLTVGDAAGDTVTVNSGAWTFAGDTTVALTGGVDGLNFDSNTLSIDASSNRVGIGTAAPTTNLEVTNISSPNGLYVRQRTDSATQSGNLFFETNTGIVSIKGSSGSLSFLTGATIGSSSGTERFNISTTGASVTGALSVSGAITYNGTLSTGTNNPNPAIRVRHIDGKAVATDTEDTLYLNYSTSSKGVVIGDSGTDHPLTVYGSMSAAHVYSGLYIGTAYTGTGGAAACWGDYSAFGSPVTNFLRCAPSSARYKNTVSNYQSGLDKVRQLRPVTFLYNPGVNTDPTSQHQQTGFIAEEVAAIDPNVVVYNLDGSIESLNYDKITAILAAGVKELDVQVQANNSRLAVVESGEFAGNLHVRGDTDFEGSLKVRGSTEVYQLTVKGKIISSGITPVASVGQALTSVLGASITNDGTDTAGTITINSGSQSSAPGEIANVQFTVAYVNAPKIVISGNNAKSSKLGAYVTRTATGFKIVTDEPVELNQTYSFDYIIIEATN